MESEEMISSGQRGGVGGKVGSVVWGYMLCTRVLYVMHSSSPLPLAISPSSRFSRFPRPFFLLRKLSPSKKSIKC